VSEVTDADGGDGTHHVNTYDGTVPVRTGDYVVHGLVKAPKGYGSQVIDKVVRGKKGSPVDSKLTLGDEIEEADIEEEPDLLDETDEYVATPAPAKKTAAPVKAASATK